MERLDLSVVVVVNVALQVFFEWPLRLVIVFETPNVVEEEFVLRRLFVFKPLFGFL